MNERPRTPYDMNFEILAHFDRESARLRFGIPSYFVTKFFDPREFADKLRGTFTTQPLPHRLIY
jgi:hypothetical protein